ncbi:MAG: TrkH family potassium uptake protein [Acetanaerobacterium sp.]
MNTRFVLYMLGRIMWLGALLLTLPLLISFLYGDNVHFAFIAPIIALLLIGLALSRKTPKNKAIFAREGFFIVALSWILLSLFGALPFFLSGAIPSYLNCLFETVSGLTTTGASILSNVEALPHSLLFWRSFTHWIGGMGVLVFMMAVLPLSDTHSVYLMRAEVPGPQVGKLVSKIRFTVRILYGIYIALTALQVIFLLFGGMPLFDSVVHAFATAGTGGFSIKNSSIAYYNSAYIEGVVGVFMILFGINFNIFYLLLAGNILRALKSEELHWYLAIITVSITAITLNILPHYEGVAKAFRAAFFQVSSIITTTGFATADFNQWPGFSKTILVLLMFFGACAGSTGGGIKIARLIILIKTAGREIRHMLSPRSVSSVKLEGQALSREVTTGVNTFFTVYMLVVGGSMLLLMLDRFGMTTSFTAVIACINNIGPGLELVGPMGNYAAFSPMSKIVLIFDMLAGRLELFPILMLFSAAAWRRR